MPRRRLRILLVLACLAAVSGAGWVSASRGAPPRAFQMWWARADNPVRDARPATRMIEAAVAAAPGLVVADVGAGAGYFSLRFARAVGPEGRVIATDADPAMVALIEREREQRRVDNLEARLVEPDDPGLEPASVDRIVMVNVVGFADCEMDAPAYFRALRAALRSGGRLVLFRDERHTTDWTPPYGDPPGCDEPSGEEVVRLARRWFRARRMEERPVQPPRRGVRPGYLIVLEPR